MHQRWQIDFKVSIAYSEGYAILITVRDVVGGAYIAMELVPAASKAAHVLEEQIQAVLLQAFREWGLPDEIQTDNEGVLVGQPQDPFPSHFTLWLQGLGIQHTFTRSGKPTDNAEVERAHRSVVEYAIRGRTTQSLACLQAELTQARHELNAEYPSRAHGCHHQPPLTAHPDLLTPRRSLPKGDLRAAFSLERVDAFLASQAWERKVGKAGQISFRGKLDRFSIGRKFALQVVLVRFDPLDRHFVVFDQHEQEIARSPAQHLSFDDLFALPNPALPEEIQRI